MEIRIRMYTGERPKNKAVSLALPGCTANEYESYCCTVSVLYAYIQCSVYAKARAVRNGGAADDRKAKGFFFLRAPRQGSKSSREQYQSSRAD